MTATSAFAILAVLSSIALTGSISLLMKNRVSVGTRLIASAPKRDLRGADAINRVPTGIRSNRGERFGTLAKWAGMGLLCVTILAACSNGSSSSPTPTITPLALTATATAQQGATATTSPANTADWPTYHRD